MFVQAILERRNRIEVACFMSFGRLFQARIVDGKNESRKRLVLARGCCIWSEYLRL